MKKMNLIIGTILVIATVLTFQLVVINKSPTDYVSLGFILFSELAHMVGTSIKNSNDLEALSVDGILTGYMLICILFSVIFGRIMVSVFNIYLLIHILLIVCTAIIVLFAYTVSKNNQNHNKMIMKQLVTMRECEAMIQSIYLNSDAEYRDELKKVYEAIKYTDKTSDVNSSNILAALKDLKNVCSESEIEHNNELIKEKSQKVISLVNERTAYNNSIKHGSF